MKYTYLIFLFSFWACSLSQEDRQEKSRSFETVKSGQHCGITYAQSVVINNHSQWEELWYEMNIEDSSGVPAIDFTKDLIIATFMGEQKSGGHKIRVVQLVEHSDQLRVAIHEYFPSGPVTLAITTPYHIIKTKKTAKEILFKRDAVY